MIKNTDAVKELSKINHPNSGLYISGKCESDLSGVRLTDGSTLSFTFDDVLAKKKELEKQYDDNKYQRDRANSYPAVKEQLDLLYHDMTAGKGDKTGEWYKAVNKVKTDNPKPE